MSIDWKLCVTHAQPPHFTAEEFVSMIAYLEKGGFLTNCRIIGVRNKTEEALGDFEALTAWGAASTSPDDSFYLRFDSKTGNKRGRAVEQRSAYMALEDALMDAYQESVGDGPGSVVYGATFGRLGVGFAMEGVVDDKALFAAIDKQPVFREFRSGISEATGRELRLAIVEDLSDLRVLPPDSILRKIRKDIDNSLALAPEDVADFLRQYLHEPELREFHLPNGEQQEVWVVSREFSLGNEHLTVVYDDRPHCKALQRFTGREDLTCFVFFQEFYGAVLTVKRFFERRARESE